MYNNLLLNEEINLNFKNVYNSPPNDIEYHIEILLENLNGYQLTKLIIEKLECNENYKEWLPSESKVNLRYKDYNLPKDKEGLASLSLYFLREFVKDSDMIFYRYNNIKPDELIETIRTLFVKKLCDYVYLNIKCCHNILYLLNRYKHKCEWFSNEELMKMYNENTSHGENNLTTNLQEFLFNSGVDYPFSNPESPSGKVDLIYGVDTPTPLTLEIKLFGGVNEYNKSYIKKGFNQAIKYANDYNQEVGYLFIYNLSDKLLEIEGDNVNQKFISINHANKNIYIIIANLSIKSASKSKDIKIERITKDYLTS